MILSRYSHTDCLFLDFYFYPSFNFISCGGIFYHKKFFSHEKQDAFLIKTLQNFTSFICDNHLNYPRRISILYHDNLSLSLNITYAFASMLSVLWNIPLIYYSPFVFIARVIGGRCVVFYETSLRIVCQVFSYGNPQTPLLFYSSKKDILRFLHTYRDYLFLSSNSSTFTKYLENMLFQYTIVEFSDIFCLSYTI